MATLAPNTELGGFSQPLANVILDAKKSGFKSADAARVRELRDYLNADLSGLYLLDERLRPNATLASRPARGFLKGYERFRNRDPIFLQLLRHRRAMDGVSLLGFEGWMRHPLARFMKNWNLQYSLQGAIWNEGRMIATLNFAREEKYGPFAPKDVADLETLCQLISRQLFMARGAVSPHDDERKNIHFSAAGKGQGINCIVSDAEGGDREHGCRSGHDPSLPDAGRS